MRRYAVYCVYYSSNITFTRLDYFAPSITHNLGVEMKYKKHSDFHTLNESSLVDWGCRANNTSNSNSQKPSTAFAYIEKSLVNSALSWCTTL